MSRPDRLLPRTGWRVASALCIALTCGATTAAPAPNDWVDDLRPITPSDWTRERAAHLLERTGFGALPDEIDRAFAAGPRAAVQALVRPTGPEDPAVPAFVPSGIPDDGIDPFPETRPIASDTAKARGEAIGVQVKPAGNRPIQPVVDKFFFWLRASALECNRIDHWWANRMLLTRRPLVERMALFWHGHFATHEDKVRDHRKMLRQVELFQRQGLGNFRTLLIAVAQDPAMLAFLDAGVNVKGAPNENFAREILEMFTMGVGHYGERDIREAARAFTGWNTRGLQFVVNADQHDDGVKTVFGQQGRYDGVQVIDLILAQPRTADYVASRLYAHFVRQDPSPALGQRLGAVLRENRYELAPLMETILLSRDFYSAASVGTRIKGPVELVVSTYRKLGLRSVPGMPDFNEVTRALGQHLLHPPTVAGWAEGRAWITPGLLIDRGNFVRDLMFPDFMAVANDRQPLITVGPEVRAVHERIRRGLDIGAATKPESSTAMGEAMMSEASRKLDREEDFNTRYGSYKGWQKAVEVITPIPRTLARIDLAGLVRTSGAQTSTEVVDLLAQRFFSVSVDAADRAAWSAFLTEQWGTERVARASTYMEDGLRTLLHVMLSSPDYQLH
ncbi:DUF1800 domain-containing protein [Leptothrix sp. BB-4]